MGAAEPGALHEDGVLEDLASAAGFIPEQSGYLQIEERYPDVETLVRGGAGSAGRCCRHVRRRDGSRHPQ